MYMYMESATFALNQKISWIRSRTGGTNKLSPINPNTAPKPARPMVCTRKYGCLGMRITPRNAIAASRRKVNPGIRENTKSQVSPLSHVGKGRIHPPSQRVTAIDDTAIMAEYSARKKRDQRKPLYSV